jgi:hypothetical protein
MSLLNNKNVSAIVKFQRRFRGYLIRKNFFKALKMNRYMEHKKKFLQHKECVKFLEKKKKVKKMSFTEAFLNLLQN